MLGTMFMLLPTAPSSLLYMRAGAPSAALPPGYAVVDASTFAGTPHASTPLPVALRELWPDKFTSDSAAKRACRRKMVRVDGAVGKCILRVAPGASVELVQRVAAGPAAGVGRRARDADPLAVAYEDDHLAIVVKPAGMPIQGRYGATGAREKFAGSLVPSRRADAQPLWRPQHVHRLDAPTSGLLVVAKTGAALRTLSACFAARLVRKKYVAIVAGALPPAARPSTIDAPLSGKHARTRWRCVASYPSLKFGSVSWLELWPHTGRTHQLRRHCAEALGRPILGDAKHWPTDGSWPREETGQGLFLSAVELELPHPATGAALRVKVAPPPKFEKFVAREAERHARLSEVEK